MLARIGRCTACDRVSRRDYSERVPHQTGTGMYRRTVQLAGRRLPSGAFLRASHDAFCPACSMPAWSARAIDGAVSKTACDARCTGATGFRCDCACGGANHGKDHLICQAEGRA